MKRKALVIGIKKYNFFPDNQKELKLAPEDAEAIANILETTCGFEVERLPKMIVDGKEKIDPNQTVEWTTLKDAIGCLLFPKNQEITSTVLLFFAGHGLREELPGGVTQGFLATSDARPGKKYGYSLKSLKEQLQRSSVKEQIIWLDCCHSGEFKNITEANPGSKQGYNRCFISACRSDEKAYAFGNHGLLTEALLEGLNPEHYPEKRVTTKSLVAFVNQKFKNEQLLQHPTHEFTGREIFLAKSRLLVSDKLNDLEIAPYKGLNYFDYEGHDPEIFYGREELTQKLINRVKESNFLVVIGASGSGKSSVIRSGLLHKLKLGEQLSGSDRWFILPPFTPGEHPLANIKQLNSLKNEELEQFLNKNDADRVVMVIDQFEEAFTLCKEISERQQFFNYLLTNLSQTKDKLCLILVIRSDFFNRLIDPVESLQLADKINKDDRSNLVTVVPMKGEELKLAIQEPAKKLGLCVEDSLVTRIVEDLGVSDLDHCPHEPGSLPLLEYTLYLLWKDIRNSSDYLKNLLTLRAYEDIGGVKGALKKRAEEIYDHKLKTTEEKQAAERIFVQLTHFEEVAEYTRRRVTKPQLVSAQLSMQLIDQVLDILVKERLVVTSETVPPMIEVAHEALIRHWDRLQGWVKGKQEIESRRRRIEAEAEQWAKIEKEKNRLDYLLIGHRLADAEEFLESYSSELSIKAIELIEYSQAERDRLVQEKENQVARELQLLRERVEIEKRTNRQLRHRTIIATSLAILAGIAFIVATNRFIVATNREKTAKSLQLATASIASLNVDTTRSLLLAIQANLIQETPQASLALWNAFQENHERFHLAGHKRSILYAEFDPKNAKQILTVSSDRTARLWNLDTIERPLVLKGHQEIVAHGCFDPQNSHRVLTVSYDQTARLWDTNNVNNPIVVLRHKGPINYGCFDPKNSHRILTASSDHTAILWDITNLKHPRQLEVLKHDGDVWIARFDPKNSDQILTVSSDGTAKIWNLTNRSKSLILKGHTGNILYGTFDPKNSNRVLTVSTDKTARVWDLNNPAQPLLLKGHEGTVKMASFDPNDPNRVLTVSEDNTARVWNLTNPDNPIVFKGHSGEVVYGTFNPKNPDQILTVGADGQAIVWEISTTRIVHIFHGHQQPINFASFNPNNLNQILTVSNDTTGKIWDISNKVFFELPRNQETIVNSTFSLEDSTQIITINRDGVVKAWNINNNTSQEIARFKTGIDSIISADFYPSNPNKIVTVNVKGIVQLWDVKHPLQPLLEMPKSNDNALSVKFNSKNPDNLFIINDNGVATIRNIKKPNEEPLVLSVPSHRITSGQFDPNNSEQIITISDDGVVRIWNVKNTSEPLLEKPTGKFPLWDASFDFRNSHRILAGGSDKVVRVWNLQKDEKPIELKGHQAEVVSGGFDPNNSDRIISASYDKTVRLWDLRIPNDPIIIRDFNAELVYSSFDPQDSNRLISFSKDGKLKIHITGGKQLLELAWKDLSRCLSPDELRVYGIEDINLVKSLSTYFNLSEQSLLQEKYRSNCQDQIIKTYEKSDFSFFDSSNYLGYLASWFWINPRRFKLWKQK